MPALSWSEGGRAASAPAGPPRTDGRIVLPRRLRRPARFLHRLVSGDLELPRHASLAASTALIAGFSLYGAVLGGHMPGVVSAVTARAGLAVEEVRIKGQVETSEIDVLERLGLDGWTSMIGLDATEARKAIATLPWVESVEVRKVYPGEIEVALVEKTPFAIWQNGGELSLIEEDGSRIAKLRGARRAALPLVVGSGANRLARDIVAMVSAHPALAARVKGYVWVGERRWDLKLDNGVTVKLPEEGAARAIDEIARLDAGRGLLSRDVLAIDMRIGDRLVVQLTPEAKERREAALEAAEKARKAKKRI
ncbi:MAG: cell division protein FtsQ/DivIB [Rhizobiaceae bacterium]|nr:cell division protein FtsQ/DivIB [Rhizobiaceae bacterium]MCV0406570.1 cell division protein FtsQ/DivIB [Rhizobiaceae bacterium]